MYKYGKGHKRTSASLRDTVTVGFTHDRDLTKGYFIEIKNNSEIDLKGLQAFCYDIASTGTGSHSQHPTMGLLNYKITKEDETSFQLFDRQLIMPLMGHTVTFSQAKAKTYEFGVTEQL